MASLRHCLPLLLIAFMAACGGGAPPAAPDDPPDPPGPITGLDIRIDTDPAGAELSVYPQVCCDGNRIYVVWYDRRNGNLDIYFNRSLDGGATWLAADRRLDSGVAGAAGSLIPRICCEGDSVYVVWYDYRSGLPDIHFNRSLDAGTTWLAEDVRIDTDVAGAASSRDPVICCSRGRLYAAWHDDRDGTWDIRFSRSPDSGRTWLAEDVRIDRNSNMSAAEYAQICCDDMAVYVAWLDDRSGGDGVRFTRSLDAGVTWPATDTPLDAADAAGIPRIACSGTNVYVGWTDARATELQVRFNRSLDAGATWLPQDVRIDDGGGPARTPTLCADGLDVFVVWSDGRDGADDVYFQRSRNGGTAWLLADVRLDDDLPGRAASWEPQVCCDGANVHVAWRDDRDGRFDVLLTHSPDRGATWWLPEVRADGDAPGAAHSIAPRLCCAGPRATVVWFDERDGPGDVYVNGADFTPSAMEALGGQR